MYQTIPVRYLDAWLEQGYTGRLIDLRTPEEYNVSHLCEAENIPFLWLQDNRQTLTGERPLLFYCARGSESLLVCGWYDRMGYEVYNLGGGYLLSGEVSVQPEIDTFAAAFH